VDGKIVFNNDDGTEVLHDCGSKLYNKELFHKTSTSNNQWTIYDNQFISRKWNGYGLNVLHEIETYDITTGKTEKL